MKVNLDQNTILHPSAFTVIPRKSIRTPYMRCLAKTQPPESRISSNFIVLRGVVRQLSESRYSKIRWFNPS
jgi:hypothetical protein